jgi:hypothetical protein
MTSNFCRNWWSHEQWRRSHKEDEQTRNGVILSGDARLDKENGKTLSSFRD